jgi:hypothetical protein
MRQQWIASEHHRLHTVEAWPDSPHKDATLRAIHSTLASLAPSSLAQGASLAASLPPCEVCLSRRRVSGVVRFPGNQITERAA